MELHTPNAFVDFDHDATIEASALTNFKYVSKGGFALVYMASLQRGAEAVQPVAVKVLKPELHFKPSNYLKFLQEVSFHTALAHPCIVRPLGFCSIPVDAFLAATPNGVMLSKYTADGNGKQAKTPKQWFLERRLSKCWALVLELMTDGNLFDHVRAAADFAATGAPQGGTGVGARVGRWFGTSRPTAATGTPAGSALGLGRYSDAEALMWMIDVADAMTFVHGTQPLLIHRDLKLENVLLRRGADGLLRAKLSDFGLTVSVDAAGQKLPPPRVLRAPGQSLQDVLAATPGANFGVRAGAQNAVQTGEGLGPGPANRLMQAFQQLLPQAQQPAAPAPIRPLTPGIPGGDGGSAGLGTPSGGPASPLGCNPQQQQQMLQQLQAAGGVAAAPEPKQGPAGGLCGTDDFVRPQRSAQSWTDSGPGLRGTGGFAGGTGLLGPGGGGGGGGGGCQAAEAAGLPCASRVGPGGRGPGDCKPVGGGGRPEAGSSLRAGLALAGGGGGLGGTTDGSRVVSRANSQARLSATNHSQVKLDQLHGLLRLGKGHQDYLPDMYQMSFKLTGQCGSVCYMAPEVARQLPYNQKADVFSFGCILFEVAARQLLSDGLVDGDVDGAMEYLTRVAWSGWRPQLPPSLPKDLRLLISLSWHREPRLRPSFPTIASRLREILCTIVAPSPARDARLTAGQLGTLPQQQQQQQQQQQMLPQQQQKQQQGRANQAEAQKSLQQQIQRQQQQVQHLQQQLLAQMQQKQQLQKQQQEQQQQRQALSQQQLLQQQQQQQQNMHLQQQLLLQQQLQQKQRLTSSPNHGAALLPGQHQQPGGALLSPASPLNGGLPVAPPAGGPLGRQPAISTSQLMMASAGSNGLHALTGTGLSPQASPHKSANPRSLQSPHHQQVQLQLQLQQLNTYATRSPGATTASHTPACSATTTTSSPSPAAALQGLMPQRGSTSPQMNPSPGYASHGNEPTPRVHRLLAANGSVMPYSTANGRSSSPVIGAGGALGVGRSTATTFVGTMTNGELSEAGDAVSMTSTVAGRVSVAQEAGNAAGGQGGRVQSATTVTGRVSRSDCSAAGAVSVSAASARSGVRSSGQVYLHPQQQAAELKKLGVGSQGGCMSMCVLM